jgi:hypothetical protein
MALNWELLNDRTAGYRSLIPFRSADGTKTTDLKFSGLRVTLSELQKMIPADAFFLGIWVDTLVIDTPVFTSGSVSVVARTIEIMPVAENGLSLPSPATDTPSVAQFLVGTSAGDKPLYLRKEANAASEGFQYRVPVSLQHPEMVTFVLNKDGSYETHPDNSAAAFKDLINRPLALNSLRASYMAATELINAGDAESLETARLMLEWIVVSTGLLGIGNNTIPGEFAELYCQASASFATINVKTGSYYVPVLSGDYYAAQISKLISALESYEKDFHTLTTSQNIDAAVSSISANLEAISRIQREPLQTDMDNIVQNAMSLGNSIQDLRFQWDLNILVAQDRWIKLYASIRNASLQRYMKAFFETAINVGKLTYDIAKIAGGSPDAKPGDALKDGAAAIMSIYAMYKALSAEFKPDSLIDSATRLVEAQRSLADSFIASSGIWSELRNNQPITQWPLPSFSDATDPELTWNLYIIEAERVLTNLDNSSAIGQGDYSGDPREAATNYLAALRVLSQYGKAISSKMVAYSQLIVTAIKLRSEMDANRKIQENWENLKDRANTDREKLAALQGILKSRMDSIRRSLFVAWTNYRNSYLYLYFATPPANTLIRTDMTAAELRVAFANISSWVGNLLAPASSKDRILLPSQDIPVTFRFPIIRKGELQDRGTQAYYTPGADGTAATITVNIPRDTDQLQGILPDRGMVPIWVRSGRFVVKGAQANLRGNIILNASTSGTYQNGFPPSRMFRFETKGVEATFAYIKDSGQPYIQWDINPAVYMTPSPFTLWTITFDKDGGDPSEATELEITFTVSFRRN